MANHFGDRIRELRIKQQLLLRQVASKLEVDTSIISKVERGERILKKEQNGTYYYEVFVAGQDAPLTGHLTILAQQH